MFGHLLTLMSALTETGLATLSKYITANNVYTDYTGGTRRTMTMFS